ncbi:hypothetical protein, partial [Dokdonella ginsengisoli]
MLDEGSLARLTEMGIDVYLPRVRGEPPRAQVPEHASAPPVVAAAAADAAVRGGVVLVAPAAPPK